MVSKLQHFYTVHQETFYYLNDNHLVPSYNYQEPCFEEIIADKKQKSDSIETETSSAKLKETVPASDMQQRKNINSATDNASASVLYQLEKKSMYQTMCYQFYPSVSKFHTT